MRLSFLTLLLAIAVTSCVVKAKPVQRCPTYHPDTEEISKIVIEYGREIEEKLGLFLYNSHCVFDDKVKKIRVDFTSQASVELCQGRQVLVDVVEGYLKRLKDHSVLRKKFNNRPISAEDLEIHITYQSFFNKYVDPEYLAYIIMENGTSYFYSSELNIPHTDVWMQKVEPYYKTKQFTTIKSQAEVPYTENEEEGGSSLQEERYFLPGAATGALIH